MHAFRQRGITPRSFHYVVKYTKPSQVSLSTALSDNQLLECASETDYFTFNCLALGLVTQEKPKKGFAGRSQGTEPAGTVSLDATQGFSRIEWNLLRAKSFLLFSCQTPIEASQSATEDLLRL